MQKQDKLQTNNNIVLMGTLFIGLFLALAVSLSIVVSPAPDLLALVVVAAYIMLSIAIQRLNNQAQ